MNIKFKPRSLGVTILVAIQDLVNKFLDIGCFHIVKKGTNWAELQLEEANAYVRIEYTRRGIESKWYKLSLLRGRMVETRLDPHDHNDIIEAIFDSDLPEETAEKIIFNLDKINNLVKDGIIL